jgi:hypothetical protein
MGPSTLEKVNRLFPDGPKYVREGGNRLTTFFMKFELHHELSVGEYAPTCSKMLHKSNHHSQTLTHTHVLPCPPPPPNVFWQ